MPPIEIAQSRVQAGLTHNSLAGGDKQQSGFVLKSGGVHSPADGASIAELSRLHHSCARGINHRCTMRVAIERKNVFRGGIVDDRVRVIGGFDGAVIFRVLTSKTNTFPVTGDAVNKAKPDPMPSFSR